MNKERVIAVIDLKAFYSFVECVDRGLDPFKTPLVVADKERGKNTIVLSVTPFLKAKGIPSRLRINDLPKKYDYIYAIPRMERYIEKSCEVMSILLDFIAKEDLHIYSIDEAFLHLTSYLSYYKMSAKQLVAHIIKTIKDKTKLECTAGIGDNFFLAKVALDIYAKKERCGIAIIHKDDVQDKLWDIYPLSKIWGIGSHLERRLNKLGMFKLGDVAKANRIYMHKHFGIIGEQLVDHANGIDEADIHETCVPKSHSLSIGQALFKDYPKDEAELIIKEMCDDICFRLRREGKMAGVVSLYIGFSKSGGFAHQSSLLSPSDDSDVIYDALIEIYHRYMDEKHTIRRININLSKLLPLSNHVQLSLFEDVKAIDESRSLNQMIDKIKQRFGQNALLRTSSLLNYSTAKERHNQIGGHKK